MITDIRSCSAVASSFEFAVITANVPSHPSLPVVFSSRRLPASEPLKPSSRCDAAPQLGGTFRLLRNSDKRTYAAMQQQMRIPLRGLLRGRTAGRCPKNRLLTGVCHGKIQSRGWCDSCRVCREGCFLEEVIGEAFESWEAAAKAGAQYCGELRLIGIASSKTILIELLA